MAAGASEPRLAPARATWHRVVDRSQMSFKWFAFATVADDARRLRYQQVLRRVHARTVRTRTEAAAAMGPAVLAIPPEVGYVVDTDGRLGDTSEAVAEVRRLAADLAPPDEAEASKPYLHDYPVIDLEPGSPLAELACREAIVSAASAYLGLLPVLASINILRSPYRAGPPAGSQLFHCDWEDVRQVKVFVHCSDVDLAGGPLTAVAAAASSRVKHQVGYRYGGGGFRLGDEEVLPRVEATDVQAFTGPAGGVTVIDTSSCLHYGSRLEAGAEPRLVVQFQYLAPTAFDLTVGGRRRPSPIRRDGSGGDVARLLVGG